MGRAERRQHRHPPQRRRDRDRPDNQTVQTTAYTDNIDKRGEGTYTDKVCATPSASCSDPVVVSFSLNGVFSRTTRPARGSRVHRGGWHHGQIRITHKGKKR